MKTLGIISEYNPFHNGHSYQLSKAMKDLKATHSVSIMSTSFTQRGEVAIMNKYDRSILALKGGINLVIELPFVYSSSVSDIFGFNSVNILNNLGIIDYLSFGVESIDKIPLLKKSATVFRKEPPTFKEALKSSLEEGNSFAYSRLKGAEKVLGEDLSFLKEPNNILALEYIKALEILKSKIEIFPIERLHIGHNDKGINNNFSSASLIRDLILNKNYEAVYPLVPKELKEEYQNILSHYIPHTLEDYFNTLKTLILRISNEELLKYPDMEIGLDNRIKNNILKYESVESFIEEVSTKRHSKNRIRRILIYILMDIKKEDLDVFKKHTPNYIKVLAFDNKGRELIKKIKEENEEIKIFTNFNKDIKNLSKIDRFLIEKEVVATNIFNQKYNIYKEDFYKRAYYLDR